MPPSRASALTIGDRWTASKLSPVETIRTVPGLVNLYGIESPGLTASPGVAREVLRQLGMKEG